MWPVIGLIWDLSKETQQRASTLDEGATLADGTEVKLDHIQAFTNGQVHEVIGGKITVNFENEGKLVLDARHIRLQIVYLD